MNKQEKINFIKEWYAFKKRLCKKYTECKNCPAYESSDGYPNEKGQYEYIDNCKYDFEDHYVNDIIELMEKYKGDE